MPLKGLAKKEWGYKYYRLNPGKWQKQNLKRLYGITVEDKQILYIKQNGACKICKKELPFNGKDTNIDHNHKTGKIRGILCRTCNRALGLFKDSKDLLHNAMEYLIENN